MTLGCQGSDSFSMYLTIFSAFSWVYGASLVTQMVKRLSAMQDTRVQSLGSEDPLEKEMATHSSILAWRISGQRSLVGYCPWSRKESD